MVLSAGGVLAFSTLPTGERPPNGESSYWKQLLDTHQEQLLAVTEQLLSSY